MSKLVLGIRPNFREAKMLILEANEEHWVLMSQAWQQGLPEVTLVRVTTIQQATNLLEAWCFQEWEIPKLMLLDLDLPGKVDGWQFLAWLKGRSMLFRTGHKTPVY